MKVNFRIEKKNLNDKKSNIRLDFTYSGKRFRKFIGIKIFNNHWHKSKQRIKSSSSDALIINKRLDVLEKKVVKIYYDLLNNNEPISNSILSEKLEDSIKGISSESTFFSYAKRFIEDGISMKKKSTLDGYRYTIGCLKRFEKYSKRKINWDTLDLKFYKEYQLYQFNVLKNSANLFGRRITDLKAIINDATKVGVNKYLDFKDFKITRTTSSRVYLNDDEIKKLSSLKLENKRLDRIRDIFLLTCYTGARFSDYKFLNLNSIENISDSADMIFRYYSPKTDKKIVTICRPETLEILKKYDFEMPKIALQKYNLYLKELCLIAGIDNEITLDSYKSGLSIFKTDLKYKFITSHTGRRSFATNLYKKGIPITHIMKATGHVKETDFLKYIQHTDEESMVAINNILKKSA